MKKILNRVIIILVLLFLLFGIGYFGTGMFGKLGKLDIFKSIGAEKDKQSTANAYTEYSAGICADGLSQADESAATEGHTYIELKPLRDSALKEHLSRETTFTAGVGDSKITFDWTAKTIEINTIFADVPAMGVTGFKLWDVSIYYFGKYWDLIVVDENVTVGKDCYGFYAYYYSDPVLTADLVNLETNRGKAFQVPLSYLESSAPFILRLTYRGEKDSSQIMSSNFYEFELPNAALEQGRTEGYEQGKTEGYEQGKTDGAAEGFESGRADGIEQGKAEGYEQGKTDGIEQGKNEGYTSGKIDGYTQGKTDGQAEGYEKGKLDGYAAGEADGFSKAKAEAFDVSDFGMFDFLKTSAGKNLIAFLSCVSGLVLVLSALSIASGVKARGC